MKMILFTFLTLAQANNYAQDKKDFDLVILIDDELKLSVLDMKMRVIKKANKDSVIRVVDYHPGSMSFAQNQLEFLRTALFDSLVLAFSETRKGIMCSYKIPFYQTWLKEGYVN